MISKSLSFQTFSPRRDSRRGAISLPSSYLSINRLNDGTFSIAINEAENAPEAQQITIDQHRRSSSLPPILRKESSNTSDAALTTGSLRMIPAFQDPDTFESTSSEIGEAPFFSVFDESLFENTLSRRQSNNSNVYEEVHVCFNEEQDPFVGILTEDAAKHACCTFKSFLKLTTDDAEILRKSYTIFGRKLRHFGLVHDNDLRSNLYDFWCWSWGSGLEGLRDYLRDAVINYDDDDRVQWRFEQCSVCLAEFRFVRKPPCCRKAICQLCWKEYVRTTAANSISIHLTGMYDLHCFNCDKFVPYSEALGSIDADDLNTIRPPGHTSCSVARCPVCLKVPPPIVTSAKKGQAKLLAKLRKKRGGRPITCDRCKTTFCGVCGMANHPDLSCKQLTVTDRGLQLWSKQKSVARPEFPNARRCPKCNIIVSHNGGCPHMTCPCGAEFCYSCGRKYVKVLSFLFPSHTSNKLLPLVSCPKMWQSTPKRLAVHSLVGFGIVATGVPLAVALSPIVLPVLGTVMLVKKLKRR